MGMKFKARLFLAAAAAVMGGLSGHAVRAGGPVINNVDWTLGTSDNWNVAADWSGGVIPENTGTNIYNVALDQSGSGLYTVTLPFNSGTFNVDSITISNSNATLELDQYTTLDLSQPDNNDAAGNLSVNNGTFDLNGGLLANAVLTVGANGTFTFGSGEFQNVTLGSNLTDSTSYSTLFVNNSVGNDVGLNTGTNAMTLSGTNTNIYFYSAFNNKFNLSTPDVLQGTLNLTGSGAYAGANSLWDLTGTINSLAANAGNAITDYSALTINTGTINAGSASVTGNTLTIQGTPFDNAGSGVITVFNGDTVQIGGNSSTSGASSSNEGIIETTTAAQGLTSGGSATIDMYGNWSNTGTIAAAGGDTVNLGGAFTAADIGMAASGPQGTLNTNGATVNLLGTLNLQGNALTLNSTTGDWNFSGLIENGTLTAQNSVGNQYLTIAQYTTGTLQNVTLGSNFTIGSNATLAVNNTLSNFVGLQANGYAINIAGGTLAFNVAYDNIAHADAPQSYGGTINITASGSINANGPLALTGTVNVVGTSGSGSYAYVYNYAGSTTNSGTMNVGSATSTGNTLSIYGSPFINSATGVMEVFNGNTLNLGTYYGSASNAGTIETVNAATDTAAGGSATINLAGSWSNTGTIAAASGDTVNLGGSFTAADVGLTGAAGEGTFTPKGATVNLTGTMNINNATATIGLASGMWNLSGGVIENGTLVVDNQTGGASYLNINYGTLQNVTLGGDLTLSADNTTTYINTTSANAVGLTFNGYAVNITGVNNALYFEGQSASQSINGNVNLTANNDSVQGSGALNVSASGLITASAGAGTFNYVDNYVYNSVVTNDGTILATDGSNLTIGPSTFSNNSDGVVEATGGATITVSSSTLSNAGTMELVGTNTALNIGGGNWTNTGTIEADSNAANAATETITLNGTFTPADVGLQSSGTGGTLTSNGATVNINGTLDNTGNTLTFSSTTGVWNLNGTIENGTLIAQNQSGGASFLNISEGTLQNVTLGGDLTLSASDAYTYISNTSSNSLGLNFNSYAVNMTGAGSTLYYENQYNPNTSQYINDTINGNVNLMGQGDSVQGNGGTLIIAANAAITASSGGDNSISGSTVINNGTIAATNGSTIDINPATFTNNGTVEASGGYLNLSPSTALTNAGTIEISGSGTVLDIGNYNGSWSNTGTIAADTNTNNAATETINLDGTFHAADVGMANDGATNGTFTANGATVNLNGTLVNSDAAGTGPNTLYFAAAGTSTSGHTTSNGAWNFYGTIIGGTVAAQDASGTQYLNIPGGSGSYGGYTGTFENVTLGSNFSLASSAGNATLQIENTAANSAGLVMNGKVISVSGYQDTLSYVDATGSNGQDIGQSIDSGTINLLGQHATITTTGTLSIASGATINAIASAGYNSENFLSGNTINNFGHINVGSTTVTGNQLFINSTNFTNEVGGVMTVYTGNNLVLEATNWTNDGTIQTSAAAGLTTQAGASLTFLFNGTAVNNGTINAASGDVVNFGSGTLTGTGTVNANGAVQPGANLSSTGTINVGSASSSGAMLFINPGTFTNSGTINVFSNNTLVLGDTDPGTTFINTGTVQTSLAAGTTTTGGATISLSGNWSNTGTISAGVGDTINLGGNFTSADVGLAAAGPQGTLNINGADVNVYSSMTDSSGATLNLGGGALTIESGGNFTMDSGSTLADATVNLEQNGGLSVASGSAITFRNVALGSIALPTTTGGGGAGTGILQGSNFSLTIENTVQNPNGFSLNGLPLILQGSNDTLAFADATSSTGQDIGQSITAYATIEGAGSTITTNGTLTLAGIFNVQIPDGTNNQAGEDFLSGNSIINTGDINIGSDSIVHNILIINPTTFTNASGGVITVYNQNVLDIAATNWSNAGTIQTAAAIGYTPAGGQGAILEFSGSWTNSGTIKLTNYDEVVFGTTPSTGSIGPNGQMINADNTGTIDVGSNSATGLLTLISVNSFTNASTGTIEVFNGNSLLLGDPYGYPTTWSNAGTIESATAAGDQTGGGAKMQFLGNWSNTGRILAAAGDTVKLEGTFTASDIGLVSGGGTLTPNGANVEIGGMMNLDGNSVTVSSLMTLTGTIANGTLASGTDTNGNEDLFIGSNSSGTFQNITLGSNYNLASNSATLIVNNSVGNTVGLDFGGNTLALSGQSTTLRINDATDSNGNDVPETLQNGTLTLSGIDANLNAGGNLTLASSLTINSTSTGQLSNGVYGNGLEGHTIVSSAHMNVGFDSNTSTVVTGNAMAIYASNFTNNGVITVYGGNSLYLGEPAYYGGGSTWTNSGSVQSNDSGGGSVYIATFGTWSNTGSITLASGDTISLGGTFNPASVAMANDGATNGTFTPNGATVNITGTLVNSDTVAGNTVSNTLYFAGPGTGGSSLATSNGTWNLGTSGGYTGTIQGGTVYAQDSTGTQWLNIYNGTLENVTLASNLALANTGSTLQIQTSSIGTPGLSLGGKSMNVTADNVSITDQSFLDTLDNGVVNLSGTGDSLNGSYSGLLDLGSKLVINSTGVGTNTLGGGSINSAAQMNVGLATVTGDTLSISPGGFNNVAGGVITVFGGNTLQMSSTQWNNAGAIATSDGSNGAATVALSGMWSNTGSITLASGDTISLGGTFNPASVAMANDGATNGTFAPNGATVDLIGTLVNSDVGVTGANTLYFAGPGTGSSSQATSDGTWNLGSLNQYGYASATGTIQGGTVYAQDSTGTQWLNIISGTFQNVVLHSNLAVSNNGSTLTISNAGYTTANPATGTNDGLIVAGTGSYQINVSGSNANLNFSDATTSSGQAVAQTLANVTVNLSGQSASMSGGSNLLMAGNATINATGALYYTYYQNVINGTNVINEGNINVGSATTAGDLTVDPTSFTNTSSGTMTAFNGSTLQIGNDSYFFPNTWSNAGTITTAVASGLQTAPGTATIMLTDNWSNTGKISAASGDTIDIGGTFNSASVAMANDGATNATFTANGATVNITGTLVNSDVVAGSTVSNTLYFGTSTSTFGSADSTGNTSNGTWNLGADSGFVSSTGTIQGGTIYAQDSTGTQYLNIISGTFQNVVLHSNLAVNNYNSTLTISNAGYTAANPATGTYDGLIVAGTGSYQINVSGSSANLDFSDATTSSGQAVAQTLANVTVNLSGQSASMSGGGNLIIAGNATINATGALYYTYYQNAINGTMVTNFGQLNAGSATTAGYLTVDPTTFTNESAGTMTAYNGSTLQIGSSYGSSNWTNAGKITTVVASGAQTGTGSATLTFVGDWSNTGTIAAATGDAINLGGTFHAADVAMANDGATNAAFTPNGATVNITGTLVNSDVGATGANTLYFAGAGTSSSTQATSNGAWNFVGGTIQGGTVVAQDASDNQFLNIAYGQSGSFQNVTLSGSFNLPNDYSSLTILNSAGSGLENGLITSGQTINVSGYDASLGFNDATNASTGNPIGQTLEDVTVNLSGASAYISAGGNLTLATNAILNGTETIYYDQNGISGSSLTNDGMINAGSATVGGFLTVDPTSFTNASGGTMTVYNGSTLQIGNGNGSTTWNNAGTITTSVASAAQTGTGSATLTLVDNWSNTGIISAAAGDTINLGGTFNPASVAMSNDGAANATFSPDGATVNITGTLINSDATGTGTNALYFAAAGSSTSSHATSDGVWTLNGGTIVGGNLMAQDATGTEYLAVDGGTLQNVTLLTNLLVTGSNNTLNINNTVSDPTGLDTNGNSVTLSGTNFTLQYNNVLGTYPNYMNQSLADGLYLSGVGDTLSVSRGALTLAHAIYTSAANGGDTLDGSSMSNTGTISVGTNGTATVSGNTLTIDPGSFTNSGTITVDGGGTTANTLQIGNGNNSTTWSNLVGGTITTSDTAGGTATLSFVDNWSNAGTISAGTGDTINLGGTFHPADVGMATDGATNGTFTPGGATINFTGTLVNSDTGATAQNTLAFTASNPWNISGGTITGGTVVAQSGGTQYLNINSGQNATLQNVTLGSDFVVDNSGATLTTANSPNNPAGLITNGYTLTFSGNGSGLNISDYRNPETGVQTGQSFNDTMNLSGVNSFINGPAGTLFTLAASGTINAYAAHATNNITLTEFTNQGVMNVGSPTVTGNTTNLNSAVFTNTGAINVFANDTLNLYVDPNSSWTNNGKISIASGGVFTSQNADGSPLNVILASGSTIDIQLGGSGMSGKFSIPNGTLTIDPNVTLDLSLAPGATLAGPYTLFNFLGLANGTFNTDFTGNFGTLSYNNGSIVVSGVPTLEPATLALLALGGSLLMFKRRRRKSA